jgi:hypothetical protein
MTSECPSAKPCALIWHQITQDRGGGQGSSYFYFLIHQGSCEAFSVAAVSETGCFTELQGASGPSVESGTGPWVSFF